MQYEDYRSRYTAVVQDRDALVEHVTDCWSVVEDSLELTALQQELSSHLVGTTALFLERAQHVSQVRDQVVTNQHQLEHVHAQQTRAMLEMRAAIHERESVVDTLTGECQQLHLQLSHVTQHLTARDDMVCFNFPYLDMIVANLRIRFTISAPISQPARTKFPTSNPASPS